MKIVVESETGIDQLADTVKTEAVIVTRNGVPMMAILPVNGEDENSWTSKDYRELMTLVYSWEKKQKQGLAPGADPGIIEASLALAGIATAIAVFLPEAQAVSETFKAIVASISSVVAFFSAFSALWLLARYCSPQESYSELKKLIILLFSPIKLGPFWLKAIGLLALLVLSAIVGLFAVAG